MNSNILERQTLDFSLKVNEQGVRKEGWGWKCLEKKSNLAKSSM